MGYYNAGNTDWLGTATAPGFSVATAGRGTAAAAGPAAAAAADAPYRPKQQMINLTALRRAFRRIDRATKVTAKLFSLKKQGSHGLKFKRKRRK